MIQSLKMRSALSVLTFALYLVLVHCSADSVEVKSDGDSGTQKNEEETTKTEDTTTTSTAAAQTGDADSGGSVVTDVSQNNVSTGETKRSDDAGEGEASRSNASQGHSSSHTHLAPGASGNQGSESRDVVKDGNPGAGANLDRHNRDEGIVPGTSPIPQSPQATALSTDIQGTNNNVVGSQSERSAEENSPPKLAISPSSKGTLRLDAIDHSLQLSGPRESIENKLSDKNQKPEISKLKKPTDRPPSPQPQEGDQKVPLVQTPDGLDTRSVSPQDTHAKRIDLHNDARKPITKFSVDVASTIGDKPHTSTITDVRVDKENEIDNKRVTNVPTTTGKTDGSKAQSVKTLGAEGKVDSTPDAEMAEDFASPSNTKKTLSEPRNSLSTVSTPLPLHHSVDKTDGILCSSSLFALAALATLAVAAAAPAH